MTNKQADLVIDSIDQFFKSYVLFGFDDDGEVHCLNSHGSSMEQHALRQLVTDAINTDCIDLMLPATKHNGE